MATVFVSVCFPFFERACRHENCERRAAEPLYREVAKMGKNMSQNFELGIFLESLDGVVGVVFQIKCWL